MTDLELNKPDRGATEWDKDLNANFEKLEEMYNEGTKWKGNFSVAKDAKDVREVAPLEQIKWAGKALGEVFYLWDHLSGVETPPNDPDGPLVFVKLTHGEAGSGNFNDGLLDSEELDGSFPLVEATANIRVGPLSGQRIHLINTEESFLRARESSGALQMDQMQRITGSHDARYTGRAYTIGGSRSSSEGAFSLESGSHSGGRDTEGTSILYKFDSAGSPNARTSSGTDGETRSKNVSATAYMRIK